MIKDIKILQEYEGPTSIKFTKFMKAFKKQAGMKYTILTHMLLTSPSCTENCLLYPLVVLVFFFSLVIFFHIAH